MKCKSCNNIIKNGEKFCTNCGESVVNEKVKKSKAPLVIGIIIIGLIVIGLGIFLIIYLKNNNTKTEPINNTIEEKNSNSSSSNTASGKVDNNNSNTSSGKVESDYTVIGNDEFGYMKAPGKFFTFQDVDGTDALQYSNGSEIVSMYAMKSEYKAKDYADGAYSKALEDKEQEQVTGATVKVGKYTAYQVYSYYPNDNTWLVRWYFDTEDGYYRYIAIEGPTYSDTFKMVDTFSLTKIN